MVGYLGLFLIFSALYLGKPIFLWKGIFIIFLYVIFDLLWTYLRDHIWYIPVSSLISGLVIAIVAISDPNFILLILLPLLAVASKQLLHFGKQRHILNPAAFAMGVMAFFMPAVSWWAVAWGQTPLIIAGIFGLIILWRQERWHVAFSFLITYAILLEVLFFWNGIPIKDLLSFLKPQIIDGTVIFFATVMLIEPLTSSFAYKKQRILYGSFVGVCAVFVTYLSGFFTSLGDPLIYGLLLGNFIASMIFLPAKKVFPVQPAN